MQRYEIYSVQRISAQKKEFKFQLHNRRRRGPMRTQARIRRCRSRRPLARGMHARRNMRWRRWRRRAAPSNEAIMRGKTSAFVPENGRSHFRKRTHSFSCHRSPDSSCHSLRRRGGERRTSEESCEEGVAASRARLWRPLAVGLQPREENQICPNFSSLIGFGDNKKGGNVLPM